MKRTVIVVILFFFLPCLHACGTSPAAQPVEPEAAARPAPVTEEKVALPPVKKGGDVQLLRTALDDYLARPLPATQEITLQIEQGDEVLYSLKPDQRFHGASTLKVNASMLAEEKLAGETDTERSAVILAAMHYALVDSDNDAWATLLNYVDEGEMLRYYEGTDITMEEIESNMTTARAMVRLLHELDEHREAYPDVIENMKQAAFTYGASDYLDGMMKYGDYVDLGLIMLLDTKPPIRIATYMNNLYGYEAMEAWVRAICRALSEAGYVELKRAIPPDEVTGPLEEVPEATDEKPGL
ncbi:MAG: hypothetical protein Q4P30_04835 [Eubacteriales bacterium]|nr:hypothetical protein [Eubacteriales bacterium]